MVDLRERLLGRMDLCLWLVIADKINPMALQEGNRWLVLVRLVEISVAVAIVDC